MKYPDRHEPLSDEQRQLVEDHMNLARSYVRKKFRARGDKLEDYDAQAFMGLVYAAKRYDPEYGRPFWAYARAWVFKLVAEYMGKDYNIKPSWDIIRSSDHPEVTADISYDAGDPDLLGLLNTQGIDDEGYDGVEIRDTIAWVKGVMNNYSEHTQSQWFAYREGTLNYEDLTDMAKMLEQEVREGI
jgi:hypothetical protein